jgi:hypothetical protein
MRASGVHFIARYLSNSPGKNLSPSERAGANAAGIAVCVVWETTADRALGGFGAGANDAAAAQREATACGMPSVPIYFAVDFDAGSGQQGAINSYLRGAASVIGKGRVGLYAGFWPVKRAFDAGVITYGWQTYAWSSGMWDSRAQLQQYHNGVTVAGIGSDWDRAVKPDYGQWPRPGGGPTPPAQPVLRKGSTDGTAVAKLRSLLDSWGAGLAHDADGSGTAFGPWVEAAVMAFQLVNFGPSKMDGVVGPDTWAALLDKTHSTRIPMPVPNPASPSPKPPPPPQPVPAPAGVPTGLSATLYATGNFSWNSDPNADHDFQAVEGSAAHPGAQVARLVVKGCHAQDVALGLLGKAGAWRVGVRGEAWSAFKDLPRG